jgi:hypothetical protein
VLCKNYGVACKISGVLYDNCEGYEIINKGIDVFIRGKYIIIKGFEEINKVIYVNEKGIKKTCEALFIANHRTRTSTFAIRTIATCNPKTTKELILFTPRLHTFCQFVTTDKRTNKKKKHNEIRQLLFEAVILDEHDHKLKKKM